MKTLRAATLRVFVLSNGISPISLATIIICQSLEKINMKIDAYKKIL